MNLPRDKQQGFTIMELLIATTVFSTMMLLATAGIVQIGRVYYKGITSSRTQETARAIVNDISGVLQLSGDADITRVGTSAYCVGTTRYTYVLNRILGDTGPDGSPHVLWVDKIRQGAACTALDLSSPTPPEDGNTDRSLDGLAFRKELLARNMRLTQFSIAQASGTSLRSVSVRVLYGPLDLSPDNATCSTIAQGGQFCAVSTLSTSVKPRIQ